MNKLSIILFLFMCNVSWSQTLTGSHPVREPLHGMIYAFGFNGGLGSADRLASANAVGRRLVVTSTKGRSVIVQYPWASRARDAAAALSAGASIDLTGCIDEKEEIESLDIPNSDEYYRRYEVAIGDCNILTSTPILQDAFADQYHIGFHPRAIFIQGERNGIFQNRAP